VCVFWFAITVRDDGTGFDPAARWSGLGLLGVRERIAHSTSELRPELHYRSTGPPIIGRRERICGAARYSMGWLLRILGPTQAGGRHWCPDGDHGRPPGGAGLALIAAISFAT